MKLACLLPFLLALLLTGCQTREIETLDAERLPDFCVAGLETNEARAFFEALQTAVRQDLRPEVAELVDYPLRVNRHGRSEQIASPEEFIARYDDVITEKIKQAVAKQTFETLFVNWQGIRIGRGEIWFAGIYPASDSQPLIRIIAVNLP